MRRFTTGVNALLAADVLIITRVFSVDAADAETNVSFAGFALARS